MSISITTSIITQRGRGRCGQWTFDASSKATSQGRCRALRLDPHAVSTGLLPKFGRYRTGPCWSLFEELAHLDNHLLTTIKFNNQSNAFAVYSFEVHERLRGDALTNVKPNEARMRELAQAPLDIHGAHADFVASARGAACNRTSNNP